ncbi:serine protease [Novosphingobium sp. AP12]|uniref:S1 family peptidase n=1 Tax=Novosphingobium sp. AP12 TaxID=1144305 RepID=UPI000271FADE|nr:serine protease [Novosphingobium sp. AP12]EJL34200.1 Trypsin [Novosphingobium sp. AP12]
MNPARVFMASICLTIMPTNSVAQASLDDQRSIVAMLQAADENGAPEDPFCAAALVMANSGGRTLLLTAQHVLDELDNRNLDRTQSAHAPLKLTVQFFGAVGRTYSVRRLPLLSNRTLDYAVLEVLPLNNAPIPAPRNWAVLGITQDFTKTTQTKVTYQDVRAIGNNDCDPWMASASAEKIIAQAGTQIIFETHFIDKGNSGGGLFAADGGLVGLVTETTGDKGIALRLDVAVAELAVKHVEIDWKEKDYSELGQDSMSKGKPYAELFAASSVATRLIDTSNDGARYRLSAETLSEYPSSNTIAVAGRSENADTDFFVPFTEGLANDAKLTLQFVDGSNKTVSVDLRTPLLAKIAELAKDTTDWFSSHGVNGQVHFAGPREKGLIKRVDAGFSPEALEYRFSTVSAETADTFGKRPAYNVVELGKSIWRPADATSLWYSITFIDGTTTPATRYDIPEKNLYSSDFYSYRGIHITRSKDGTIFPYYYAYGFNGMFPDGTINLLHPYGMRTYGRLQYDMDGKGFRDIYAQLTYGIENPIPWTTKPIRVRYVNAETGQIVGPFDLSGFDVAAIRDATMPEFPRIACGGRTHPGTCEFDDPRALGHVRELRISFSSLTGLKPVKLGTLSTYWSKAGGATILAHCVKSQAPECISLKRQLNIAWDIPAGASDFFYTIVMRDGRILPPQRMAF